MSGGRAQNRTRPGLAAVRRLAASARRRFAPERWRALVVAPLLTAACDGAHARAPAAALLDVACYAGEQGRVALSVCELTDAASRLELRAGRWLPPRARALRARSHVAYGRAESAADERLSTRAKERGSYLRPHFDLEHEIAGWDLYDVDERLALIWLILDERWAVICSQTDANDDRSVLAALERFLASPLPVAERAQALQAPADTEAR